MTTRDLTGWQLRWKSRLPVTRMGKTAFWSVAVWLVLWPLEYVHGTVAGLTELTRFLAGLVALVCYTILLYRWMKTRLLWSLRNRLAINYLLVGLAPILLLSLLFGIISYSLAGQFAVFAATSEIDRGINVMRTETAEIASHAAHAPPAPNATEVVIPEAQPDPAEPHTGRTLNIFCDGRAVAVAGGPPQDTAITSAPPWTHGVFGGMVRDHDGIFIRSVATKTENGHTVLAIASEPVTDALLKQAAEGLGRVTMARASVKSGEADDEKVKIKVAPDNAKGAQIVVKNPDADTGPDDIVSGKNLGVSSGELPPKTSWTDINVTFATPISIRDWGAGDSLTTIMSVSSRPSLLYHRLFSSSVGVGGFIRIALISIAIIFAIIEAVALFMAVRLNRTITRSVADLYAGTRRVDAGDLAHQIPVRRRDQLGELGYSFNSMTSSLQRLLAEQKEKERLQNELAIAQQVQATLFPQSGVALSGLEVHGICRPARTVSGDYYDFLVFSPISMGIALGDISGKGISAALLMASLHSAVRAYRVAAEEIGAAEDRLRLTSGAHGDSFHSDWAKMFECPGKLLELLNRHLYRSTQPEKYATLWLGSYESTRNRLTYSNGGQLPPLVLCASGEVKRLDAGGSVVGLMDGMTYDEGHVDLQKGDIVIAYSDGVTEPENEYGDFGEDRLVELVRQHRNAPLETISGHVMAALTDWIGAEEQPDDITLVLARQG